MKAINKKLVCISAETKFYKKGDTYQVYKDEEGREFVRGSDGVYDRPYAMSSRFCEET